MELTEEFKSKFEEIYKARIEEDTATIKEELESDFVRIHYETEKIEYLLQSWQQYRRSISRL